MVLLATAFAALVAAAPTADKRAGPTSGGVGLKVNTASATDPPVYKAVTLGVAELRTISLSASEIKVASVANDLDINRSVASTTTISQATQI